MRTIALMLAACFALNSCETLLKVHNNPAVRIAEHMALAALVAYGTGRTIDVGWGMVEGINAVSGEVSRLENNRAARLLKESALVAAGTRDKPADKLASAMANTYTLVDPQTPSEKMATVQGISEGLSRATRKFSRDIEMSPSTYGRGSRHD